MIKKCNHCKKDTGGFKYCNEFCEIQGLKKEKENLDKQLFTQDSDYNDIIIALKEEHEKELKDAREAFEKIKDLTYNDFDHDVIRVHRIACKQLKEQSNE